MYRECLFEKSDPYVASVCALCGFLCDPVSEAHPAGWCANCNTSEHTKDVAMPFACKLTLQEM